MDEGGGWGRSPLGGGGGGILGGSLLPVVIFMPTWLSVSLPLPAPPELPLLSALLTFCSWLFPEPLLPVSQKNTKETQIVLKYMYSSNFDTERNLGNLIFLENREISWASKYLFLFFEIFTYTKANIQSDIDTNIIIIFIFFRTVVF